MADFKFRHAGQVCIAPTRFLVQNPVADAFKASFVKAARSMRVWLGTDPTSEIGPLANDRRIPALNRMVADAVGRERTPFDRGSTHWQRRELLRTHCSFRGTHRCRDHKRRAVWTGDEACAESNRLAFGLAAYAWTSSSARPQRLQDEVQSGMLSINQLGLGAAEVPFSGIKDQGFRHRDRGRLRSDRGLPSEPFCDSAELAKWDTCYGP